MLTNETKDRYGLFIPDEVVTVLNRKNKLTKSGYVEITTVVLYIIVQEILTNFGFNIESKYDKSDYNISQADIDRIATVLIYSNDIVHLTLSQFLLGCKSKRVNLNIDTKVSLNMYYKDYIITVSRSEI